SVLAAASETSDGCDAAVMFNSICVPTSLIRLMKLSHNSLTQGGTPGTIVINLVVPLSALAAIHGTLDTSSKTDMNQQENQGTSDTRQPESIDGVSEFIDDAQCNSPDCGLNADSGLL
ncbi:hypothetical protein, partial [Massilia sp. CCM 8734]|uniref:hypothetical protein n=1 Tax=Massilia sp. CCM 8734 TaxID=2609283 RepID=UPI001AAF7A11